MVPLKRKPLKLPHLTSLSFPTVFLWTSLSLSCSFQIALKRILHCTFKATSPHIPIFACRAPQANPYCFPLHLLNKNLKKEAFKVTSPHLTIIRPVRRHVLNTLVFLLKGLLQEVILRTSALASLKARWHGAAALQDSAGGLPIACRPSLNGLYAFLRHS